MEDKRKRQERDDGESCGVCSLMCLGKMKAVNLVLTQATLPMPSCCCSFWHRYSEPTYPKSKSPGTVKVSNGH